MSVPGLLTDYLIYDLVCVVLVFSSIDQIISTFRDEEIDCLNFVNDRAIRIVVACLFVFGVYLCRYIGEYPALIFVVGYFAYLVTRIKTTIAQLSARKKQTRRN